MADCISGTFQKKMALNITVSRQLICIRSLKQRTPILWISLKLTGLVFPWSEILVRSQHLYDYLWEFLHSDGFYLITRIPSCTIINNKYTLRWIRENLASLELQYLTVCCPNLWSYDSTSASNTSIFNYSGICVFPYLINIVVLIFFAF